MYLQVPWTVLEVMAGMCLQKVHLRQVCVAASS